MFANKISSFVGYFVSWLVNQSDRNNRHLNETMSDLEIPLSSLDGKGLQRAVVVFGAGGAVASYNHVCSPVRLLATSLLVQSISEIEKFVT